MKQHLHTSICVVAVLLVTLSIATTVRADRTDPLGGTGGGPIDGSLHVQVVYDGTTDPFEGAFVMVGLVPGFPFADNWGFTPGTGEIVFTDPDLQGPIAVTVGAAGHQYFTLYSVDADELVIPLKPISSAATTYEVGDYVSGIDVDNGFMHAGDGNVDMAFVLPALKLADVMSFDVASLLGPPEIIEILGEPFEIPSNFFIPQQWELFIEIIKDHYYLYLPAGDFTLTALSGRIATDDLLGGGEIQDLLPQFQWREIDILDVTIAGDTYTADLHVDPDLNQTVTLNLSNVPDNSIAYCISAGDLDNLEGLGRLIPLGISSLDCPGGSGPCAGTVHLTTTPASGEFAGMAYFPVVAAQVNESDDMLVLMDRTPRGQTYTANMGSFYERLDLVYDTGDFHWNDVENPSSGSPPVDVQIARIANTSNEEIYWEFMFPGDELEFVSPVLPAEAPPGAVVGSTYTWEQVSLGLDYNLPSFDFDDFAFGDVLVHGSHLALDQMDIIYAVPLASAPDAPTSPILCLHGGHPNPFSTSTTIHFETTQTTPVDLSIWTLDGRRVATLAGGRAHAGLHRVTWHGCDALGRRVPSGVYLARLRTRDAIAAHRVLLLR
jgi:hypothetical protein